jgi:hypothetical protein
MPALAPGPIRNRPGFVSAPYKLNAMLRLKLAKKRYNNKNETRNYETNLDSVSFVSGTALAAGLFRQMPTASAVPLRQDETP